jgi:allantoinase
MSTYDLVIKNGDVVIPYVGVQRADIGVIDGKIAAIQADIDANGSDKLIDATGLHVFPGAIDSHFHIGIYRPYAEDAESESASAASGGVTTVLSYFRTGKDYLNKVGPYKEILPELVDISEKSFVTDFGYHLACMTDEHLTEIDWLVKEGGVSTLKYYMFYKLITLAGATAEANSYLMINNSVDFGYLYRFMKEVAKANEKYKDYGGVSLSIHCENPEIIQATQGEVKANPCGIPMKDYSNARPPWQEELAINEAAIMAKHTNCPVNLLHLSSRLAVAAGVDVSERYPEIDFLLEATLHHLGLNNDMELQQNAKVNPPIRSKADQDFLWQSLIDGTLKTVVSDHACPPLERKEGDLWSCMPGFGGTSLMFPVLLNDGYHKRGMPLHRIAEVSSANPAKYHNLYPKKGAIMVGSDADFAIVDINKEQEITLENLHTAQEFSPELGMNFKGWNQTTILRGKVIFEKESVIGKPGSGRFIKRPVKLHYK